MNPSPITVANEQVSIVLVCQMLGVDLPDDVGAGRSRKVHCPFGEFAHSDGGVSPAMRIYPDSNSAYCFSCAAYFNPVGLAAQGLDVDRHTAAVRLLDRIGYRPLDPAAAWHQALECEVQPDKALMADALKTYCRRIDKDWTSRQFEPAISAPLARCLSLLDLVHSEQDVTMWLSCCKAAMRRALHIVESSATDKYGLLWEEIESRKTGES